jgi:hypothetical protein
MLQHAIAMNSCIMITFGIKIQKDFVISINPTSVNFISKKLDCYQISPHTVKYIIFACILCMLT